MCICSNVSMNTSIRRMITYNAMMRCRRKYGEETIGFKFVASGPLVRSSYRAGEFFVDAMIRGERAKTALKIQ